MALISLTTSRPPRRGVALLLALAMIVLIVPVALGFTQRALLAGMDERVSEQGQVADSIRTQLEAGPLQNWLSTESGKVALPVEAPTPRVDVLHEHWEFDDCEYEVRITAWDQCGMAPWEVIATGSPLRAAVPARILERARPVASDRPRSKPLGLDQVAQFTLDAGGPVLPSAFPSPDERDASSPGAWIATHPVGEYGSINVNTAPLPLIQAAFGQSGRGGIELILAARREGRVGPLPAAVVAEDAGAQLNAKVQLIGASACWALRIDVRVGLVRRSWWSVYRQSSGRWECVQRLVIPD
ncbi:MAG: hypothetical protein IT430_20440 [Phycisphaerales bacterium]|nr:hypothetical protein [Phycisphaerales bacterium]